MKRFNCRLWAVLVLTVICVFAAAACSERAMAASGIGSDRVYLMQDGAKELRQKLITAVWNGEGAIDVDLAAYGVSFEEFDSLLAELSLAPETFAVQSYNYSWTGSNYTVNPVYYKEIYDSYDDAKAYYTSELDRIASLAEAYENDLEKALFINDYLCENYNYDYTYSRRDVYSFLKDGVGVCQAYTRTVIGIMDKLGIECSFVRSDSMNHVWNIVKLNGEWYHLDVTWNDSKTSYYPWMAAHKYFLSSTAWMKSSEAEHFKQDDWIFGEDVRCSDSKYDSYFWKKTISHFVKSGGSWYCVDEDGLCRWDGSSSSITRLAEYSKLLKQFYPGYDITVTNVSSGLAVLGDNIYFNSIADVIRYNIKTGQCESLLSVLFESMRFLSLTVDGTELVYRAYGNSGEKEGRISLINTTEMPEGHFSYSVLGDELTVTVEEGAGVMAVCFDDAGKMLYCSFAAQGVSSVFKLKGQIKLISISNETIPVCEAVCIPAA